MLKSVLVALDESPWSEAARVFAIDMCKRFNARLLGVGIVDKPSITAAEPVPLGASRFKVERDEEKLIDADKRVRKLLKKFQSNCQSDGVPAETLEIVGSAAECIVRQAHRCDIVVLGRETPFRFETQDEPDPTLGQVLRSSPRPVVAVPRTPLTGNGIMVAYGGGKEVARALQAVQLLDLTGGEIVHLVSIRTAERDASTLVPFAAKFLQDHGVRHDVNVREEGGEPADILLQEVNRLQPRLLVMGAPGYHPLRDLFFTSVTRAVVDRSPVPVLIGA